MILDADNNLKAILRHEAELAETEEDSDTDVWVPKRLPMDVSMPLDRRLAYIALDVLRMHGIDIQDEAIIEDVVLAVLRERHR